MNEHELMRETAFSLNVDFHCKWLKLSYETVS